MQKDHDDRSAELVYARRTARVLLLDAADRVLLLRVRRVPDDPAAGHEWYTPGGGVEEGESLEQAAARELREETGLLMAPEKLVHVATTSGQVDWGWVSGLVRDDFFLLRIDAHQVDTSGQTALEQRDHDGFRWWPIGELRQTTAQVWPPSLAELLTNLLTGAEGHVAELPWAP